MVFYGFAAVAVKLSLTPLENACGPHSESYAAQTLTCEWKNRFVTDRRSTRTDFAMT